MNSPIAQACKAGYDPTRHCCVIACVAGRVVECLRHDDRLCEWCRRFAAMKENMRREKKMENNNLVAEGMTLRDWFAGQALAGMLAYPESSGTIEAFAKYAYQYADAMMAERGKR